MPPKFVLIIDPNNNISKGADATIAWDNYTQNHNTYILSDCRVLECSEREVKLTVEFL